MVSAISSTSVASTILGSGSSTSSESSESTAGVEAQIASKKAELAQAKDDATKQSLQSEIDALETQLAKLEAAKKTDNAQANAPAAASLSGESNRIGSGNVSEDAEFGDRFLYV